jgi:DHA2 family multidrug resistance protein
VTDQGAYPDPTRRFLITVPSMLASTMVAVDITIANVALPHMQSSLQASSDQIVWVLTSYLIAAAIATPLSGWLAGRFGRREVMIFSVVGFTAASALCGAATSLMMIVLARALQGACGAALIPLSQALLLDINPPERLPRAMAIFSVGSMFGPIAGPTLGGWLTESFSWRWVFFINVPFGVLSLIGFLTAMPGTRNPNPGRFDLFGFATVSIALASFQLMIDRGESQDWFESPEIQIYAAILALAIYLGTVHVLTARNTFLRPELFKDRNFAIGCVMRTVLGVVIFATIPLIVVMTQSLLGYSALRTGLVGMPRALGTIVSMVIAVRFANKVDIRVLLFAGLVISAVSMLLYANIDLYLDQHSLLVVGFVQGMAGGLVFMPLSVMVFATLSGKLRNEGAAMFSLTGNIGNAVGISLLQRQLVHYTAASRAHLVDGIRPDNPLVQFGMPDLDFTSLDGLVKMNGEIGRQAAMVGNVEVYKLVFLITLVMLPLTFLMRTGRGRPKPETLAIVE